MPPRLPLLSDAVSAAESLLQVGDLARETGKTVRAIHLYEAAGFRTTGIRRGYYTDNREDAYVMWKDPIPALDDAREVPSSRAAGQVLEERRA